MKLIKANKQTSELDNLCRSALKECEEVWAAVAYVSEDKSLILPCYKKQIKLKLWARYDYSVPVNVSILEWFIGKDPMAICKLIPDIFHPKVIWWKGYGAYIGSANLSGRAWNSNFEAGMFLTEEELEEEGIQEDLISFFGDIDDCSHALTREIVAEANEMLRNNFFSQEDAFKKEFEKNRLIKRQASLIASKTRNSARTRRQNDFLQEWNSTLEILRTISGKIVTEKLYPAWVHTDIPGAVITDQFLHAYYYYQVMNGHTSRYREFYDINSQNPLKALEDALQWWQALPSAPSNEDRMMHEWAPFIRSHLTKNRVLSLTEDEFVSVFHKVHAFRNYADRTSYKTLGLAFKLEEMKSEQRGELVARQLFNSMTPSGKTVLNLLYYILYAGNANKLPERLFEVARGNDDLRIRLAGLSTFGEVVGWALPDRFPPRNDRTNKALRALGYDVKVYA